MTGPPHDWNDDNAAGAANDDDDGSRLTRKMVHEEAAS